MRPQEISKDGVDFTWNIYSDCIVLKAGNGIHPVGVIHLDLKTKEVYGLLVLEEVRGKGIATALINKIEQKAKEIGLNEIYMTTDLSNKAMIGLCEKHQYKKMICFEKSLLSKNICDES